MAGWYTNFDRSNRTIDLGAGVGERTGRPLLFSVDNSDGAGGSVNAGTDALIILKAGEQPRELDGAESAGGTTLTINLTASGLNTTSSKYGLLVKSDLHTADFFDVTDPDLSEHYLSGDMVSRADIIIYKVLNDAGGRPMLYRRNLGNDNGYQVVAENIDNLQVSYQLNDDSWVSTPVNQALVRAVEVTLVGRTAQRQRGYTDTNMYVFPNDPAANYTPNDPFRRKVLSTTVKTRNVGL